MFFAPEECLGENQGKKRSPIAAGSPGLFPGSSLQRSSSKDALRKLQDKRFQQESKQHPDLEDWLIWLFPKPEPWVHRLVDRLLVGDTKTAQKLFRIRREMGL